MARHMERGGICLERNRSERTKVAKHVAEWKPAAPLRASRRQGTPPRDVPRGHEEPRGGPAYQARALTACSMRSIPFSMFFMDMA
jgi:hypothetical protein